MALRLIKHLQELAAGLEKTVQDLDGIREKLAAAHAEDGSDCLNANEIALRAKLDIAWLDAENATRMLEEAASIARFLEASTCW